MDSVAEEVSVEFSLKSERGSLRGSMNVPAGHTTLTALLPILQDFESLVAGRTAELSAEDGHAVSCKAGCGACCRQMVPISPFEAEALATWVRGLPANQQQELERRFAGAVDRLREKGMLERMAPGGCGESKAEMTQLARDYLLSGVACPFLVQESCSIHPIRPLICREYLVSSPPEFCRDPQPGQVEGVTLPVALSLSLFRLGTRVKDHERGWLPLVMLFEWMKLGARPGEAVTGTGVELVQQLLGEMADPPAAGETGGWHPTPVTRPAGADTKAATDRG